MKVLLDIQDNKASFFMEMIENFSFIKTEAVIPNEANESVEDYMMLEIMRSRKSEDTLTLEEFKAEVGWK